MKTITYTQMRSDLSTTLEDLRSGEIIIVTQRGKPDLVISAKVADQSQKTIHSLIVNNTLDAYLGNYIASTMSPQAKEGAMKIAKQLEDLLKSEEARKALVKVADTARVLHGVSESFAKALQHTQSKHAEIIKKLEDK